MEKVENASASADAMSDTDVIRIDSSSFGGSFVSGAEDSERELPKS